MRGTHSSTFRQRCYYSSATIESDTVASTRVQGIGQKDYFQCLFFLSGFNNVYVILVRCFQPMSSSWRRTREPVCFHGGFTVNLASYFSSDLQRNTEQCAAKLGLRRSCVICRWSVACRCLPARVRATLSGHTCRVFFFFCFVSAVSKLPDLTGTSSEFDSRHKSSLWGENTWPSGRLSRSFVIAAAQPSGTTFLPQRRHDQASKEMKRGGHVIQTRSNFWLGLDFDAPRRPL